MSYDFLKVRKCAYCGLNFKLVDSIGIATCYYHPKSTSYDRELDEQTYDCCGRPYYHFHGCQKKSHSDLESGKKYYEILISDLIAYKNSLPSTLRDFMINEKVMPGIEPKYIKISVYEMPKYISKPIQSNEKDIRENDDQIIRPVELGEVNGSSSIRVMSLEEQNIED